MHPTVGKNAFDQGRCLVWVATLGSSPTNSSSFHQKRFSRILRDTYSCPFSTAPVSCSIFSPEKWLCMQFRCCSQLPLSRRPSQLPVLSSFFPARTKRNRDLTFELCSQVPPSRRSATQFLVLCRSFSPQQAYSRTDLPFPLADPAIQKVIDATLRAFLSCSSRHTATEIRNPFPLAGPAIQKVIDATKIAQQQRPDLAIEGPLQYDAAVNPQTAKTKLKGRASKVAGQANVLIFPDLNTGNNTYKAVQQVGMGLFKLGLKREGW